MALRRCTSLQDFENNAMKEIGIICEYMKDLLGTGFSPIEPYILHIFENVLTEWRDPNPEDITDSGGRFPTPISIRKFPHMFKTIEYIIFPEIFTEYVMKIKNLPYDDASCYLYGNNLPCDKTSNNFVQWSLFR